MILSLLDHAMETVTTLKALKNVMRSALARRMQQFMIAMKITNFYVFNSPLVQPKYLHVPVMLWNLVYAFDFEEQIF